jgi:hypothetical protein
VPTFFIPLTDGSEIASDQVVRIKRREHGAALILRDGSEVITADQDSLDALLSRVARWPASVIPAEPGWRVIGFTLAHGQSIDPAALDGASLPALFSMLGVTIQPLIGWSIMAGAELHFPLTPSASGDSAQALLPPAGRPGFVAGFDQLLPVLDGDEAIAAWLRQAAREEADMAAEDMDLEANAPASATRQ